ncbi:leucyl aminopeptidase family protein [Pseudoruegeria sp. SHC-113]|uniref:leucyl aminopeptidase family protein n=1 Tax=Pseudoruegeria sp. SHC-113 TaxID=2855439 RepID=UPI0021BA7EBA|nr:leucyl aminopeptidase family protein [Pseudoruegeria sp. SHC-113]MCT8158766.1 leucyl aminopeptidase family protein [Pseudoruegeria sp. SHC-113]
MPDFFADATDPSLPVHAVEAAGAEACLSNLEAPAQAWAQANGFSGALGETLLLPGENGAPSAVLIGLGDARARARKRLGALAGLGALPAGSYHLASDLPAPLLEEFTLGWLLSGYAYDRYAGKPAPERALKAPEGVDAARLNAMVVGEFLTRDLINTPANDMGPEDLEAAVHALSVEFDADVSVIRGEDLLEQNFPMIHAVGRASPRAPRLLDLRWGSAGPALTLVGKGVCFDTGGLNLKPGSSMALMKKDMGGAATVLGLASMIMALNLPLRLRVLIPAVENAVGGPAFRPGDILTARNGLTVEINNTDAEGRLVLADALSLAAEETPDLLISMATLTGAARVAVGPDLAPFYATQQGFAAALGKGAELSCDPVWQMPFWEPYEAMIEPGIADLDNAPGGGFAGSITAALFLRRFTGEAPSYAHFDIYGWQPSAAPARPKGGAGQGARAILAALPEALGL